MASNAQEIAAMPSAQERSIRGPPCNQCVMNSGVPMCLVRDRLTIPERNYMHAHHHAIRRICHQCLQYILDERHMRWWRFLFHGHLILDDPILVPRITEWVAMPASALLEANCSPQTFCNARYQDGIIQYQMTMKEKSPPALVTLI